MTRWRAGRLAVGVLLAAGLTACGDDGGDGAQAVPSTVDPSDITSTTEADPSGALPPAGARELEPPLRRAAGRAGPEAHRPGGGLIDRSGGGYEPSAEGTHLALYVEPVGDRTVPQYLDGIRGVAVVFADVFERWPGLVSYDVCQEPAGDDDLGGGEPLPVTQIELTKEEAAAFDWDTVSVIDLVRAAEADPPGLAPASEQQLGGGPRLRRHRRGSVVVGGLRPLPLLPHTPRPASPSSS